MSLEDGMRNMGIARKRKLGGNPPLPPPLPLSDSVSQSSPEELSQSLTKKFSKKWPTYRKTTVYRHSSTQFYVGIEICPAFPDIVLFINASLKKSTVLRHPVYSREEGPLQKAIEKLTFPKSVDETAGYVKSLRKTLTTAFEPEESNKILENTSLNFYRLYDFLADPPNRRKTDPFDILPPQEITRTREDEWEFSVELKFICMRDRLFLIFTYNAEDQTIKLKPAGYSKEYGDSLKAFVTKWNKAFGDGDGQVLYTPDTLKRISDPIVFTAWVDAGLKSGHSIWLVLKNTMEILYGEESGIKETEDDVEISGSNGDFSITIKLRQTQDHIRLAYNHSDQNRSIEQFYDEIKKFKEASFEANRNQSSSA